MAMPSNPLRGHYALDQQIGEGRDHSAAAKPIRQRDIEASVISFSEPGVRPADFWKGSWHWDLRTNITSWSEQLYWMVGRDKNQPVPCFKEHSCFYAATSWDQLVEATLQLLRTGEPYELRLQMLHSDGTRRSVVATGEAVRDPRGQMLQLRGTVEDISEQQRQVASRERKPESKAQAEGKTIGRLIQAQERERCQVASALRDNVCQRVSLLAASIQGLSLSSPELSPEAHTQLEDLWQYATETLCELDRISEQLHSSDIDLLGFTLSIQSLCRRVQRESGVVVDCSCSNVDQAKVGNEVLSALFRIAQLALDNIARHSRASDASVKVSQNSEEIVLHVADDGVGFERGSMEAGTGIGFIRLRELVREMRGDLEVWSQPGHGTSIQVRIPLNGSTQDDCIMAAAAPC